MRMSTAFSRRADDSSQFRERLIQRLVRRHPYLPLNMAHAPTRNGVISRECRQPILADPRGQQNRGLVRVNPVNRPVCRNRDTGREALAGLAIAGLCGILGMPGLLTCAAHLLRISPLSSGPRQDRERHPETAE
jgi:hypothetical protein